MTHDTNILLLAASLLTSISGCAVRGEIDDWDWDYDQVALHVTTGTGLA